MREFSNFQRGAESIDKRQATLYALEFGATMPMFNPPHPGEVIRNEIIEAHGMTVTAAAKVLGVSRQALSALLNAQADLTGDMALRLEKAFGPKMETLMGMQYAFDIFQTRQRAEKIKVRPYQPVTV